MIAAALMVVVAFASPALAQVERPDIRPGEEFPADVDLPDDFHVDEWFEDPFNPGEVVAFDHGRDQVFDSALGEVMPLGPEPGPGPPPVDELPGERDPALDVFFGMGDAAVPLDLNRFLSQTVIDEAYLFTLYEVALLFELEAFEPSSEYYATFAAIHAGFDWSADHTRADTLRTFRAIDNRHGGLTQLFRPAVGTFRANTMFAVGRLPSAMEAGLSDGVEGQILGFEYAATLVRLSASSTVLSAAIGDTRVDGLTERLQESVVALEAAEDLNELLSLENEELRAAVAALSSITPPAPQANTSARWLIGGGAATILMLGAGAILYARRRETSQPTSTDSSVETHRLLAGAGSTEQVAAIIAAAADQAIGAPATLFRTTPDGLTAVGREGIITASMLNGVSRSAMPLVTVLTDDPAWPAREVAVVAVPITHQNEVLAVVAAHRPGAEAFRGSDIAELELLAPAIGGALARADQLDSMQDLAMLDPLTSLANRRRLDGDLETSLADAVGAGTPVAFAMIDVDHFKAYNDTHGHGAGDDVLRQVGATIARCVRDSDIVYRYGGEEFSILLPGATPDEANAVAERVRAEIEASAVPGGETQPGGRLTVSVGVATLDDGSADDIKDRADAALYRAKEAGRNQVVMA